MWLSQGGSSQRPSQMHLLPNTEEFRKVLKNIGVQFPLSLEKPYIFTQEQALVTKDLIKLFQKGQDCQGFLSGFKYLCKREKYLKKFLAPTQLCKSSDDTKIIYQDSLISVFLKVPQLQDDILDLLLNNLASFGMEENEDVVKFKQLLRPLRCLPTIKNGEKLAKKLLDIIEISTFPCQLEILESLPEILPDDQCHMSARELIKLLDGNVALCGPIVDCLTALNLEAEAQLQVHDRILTRITSGVPSNVYLILIKFLLSQCKQANLNSTLLKIRSSLDNILSGSGKETISDKTVILNYIQSSCVAEKLVAEGWLNLISNIKVATDHKPVDLLLIFILHHVWVAHQRVIESVLRKRVSQSLISVNLLTKMLEKYINPEMMKNYIRDIIELGSYLLKFSKDGTVAKFAITLFKYIFNHEGVAVVYRGEILFSLILLTSSNDNSTINTVLRLISSLIQLDHHKVQTHLPTLMQLLEKLDTLELNAIKIIYDILCSLVCTADDSYSGFKDQIFNSIRKQASCCERSVKRRAIVSAICMVKHMASVRNEQDEEDDFESPTMDSVRLTRGPAKEVKELLDLINRAAGTSTDLLSLYYDQLASMLASDIILDKYILYWLYKKFREEFDKTYITDSIPPDFTSRSGLQLTTQFVLQTDYNGVINLGDKSDKIMLLPSHFRVLRLLYIRQEEHLRNVSHLLTCGVAMPQAQDPELLEREELKELLDCLVFCVNWFRELISAFVSQKDKTIQAGVIKRLEQVIELEKKIGLLLPLVPGHHLPQVSVGEAVHKPTAMCAKSTKKPPRKRVKSNAIVNDTSMISTQRSGHALGSTSKVATPSQLNKLTFRELDTDVILLVKYPLSLEGTEDATLKLNIYQVTFILSDFIEKLKFFHDNGKSAELSPLNDVNPEDIIRDCAHVIRNCIKFLDTLIAVNVLVSHEAKSGHHPEILACFGHILKIFHLVFDWPLGFPSVANQDVLNDLLKATSSSDAPSSSTNRLVLNFMAKLCDLAEHFVTMAHATCLVQVLQALEKLLIFNKEADQKIHLAAKLFLGKRWYDPATEKPESGQVCNQNLNVLVQAFTRKMKCQEILDVVETLLEDIPLLKVKDEGLTQFPAVDGKSFHVFYLGLCNALLAGVKEEIQSLTNSGHVALWTAVSKTLEHLMNIAKSLKTRLLACFLKKTIAILKVFHIQGIPMLEITLKRNPNEVVDILKTIQTTTRFLHHLCCQSKLTRDGGVVPYIPSFRQTIEAIIYRVKAALVANNCTSAFWLGNLRNKDLDGEDILSQSTVISTEEDNIQRSNEELRSNDDDDLINDDGEEDGDDNQMILDEGSGDDETRDSDVV